MIKVVDARGDVCPIPVVKTKNAIKELGAAGGTVQTMVDNEIAVQNLTKMAQQKGYTCHAENIGRNLFRVTMEIMAEAAEEANEGTDTSSEEQVICRPDVRSENTVVVISSDCMGSGDDTLGAALMKSFLFALAQQEKLPAAILFYNGGVKMTSLDSPAIEDLKTLEAEGVEILSCGTCLNHYGLTDQLKVGGITNMYVIVEKQMQADKVIRP